MKTSELTGAALDWAVCEATGLFAAHPKVKKNFFGMWQRGSTYYIHPSTDWAQGGPIIEREAIALTTQITSRDWMAISFRGDFDGFGPTLLIAAMRCYVASKLGNEVDVPEEA